MTKKKKGKIALLQTTEDFAERTSIHGISYVFDRGLRIVDRLLWAVLVICFLGLAFYLTWNSWTQWRDQQVGIIFLPHILMRTLRLSIVFDRICQNTILYDKR